MNKKKLLFGIVLPLFILGIISAGILYYDVFSATFNTTPAINVDGDLTQLFGEVIGGETIIGSEITLINNAPSERTISITDDSGNDVDVNYMGILELTKKILAGNQLKDQSQ